MKALVLEEPGPEPRLSVRDVPTPQPGPHEALIRVAACGLCHHDVLAMRGLLRRGVKERAILGHEIAGEVVIVGQGVTHLSVGDRVVTLLTEACGACLHCRAGREHRCLHGQGIGHGRDGGFAEYVCLQESSLVALPQGLELDTSCVLGCPLGVAVEALHRRARLQPGETALIAGAGGGLGAHALQVALAGGARVLAVTTSPDKVEALQQLGAHEVILAQGELDFGQVALALTENRGAEVVVNAVGSALFLSCWAALAQYGRLLMVGEITGDQVSISPAELIFRDAHLIGSSGTSRESLQEAAHLVSQGQVRPLVSRFYSLEEAQEAYQTVLSRRALGRVALRP